MTDLSSVPEADRDKVVAALAAAFDGIEVLGLAPVGGGASGARAWRVATAVGDHLLRVEGAHLPGRNPHQYGCLASAAAAGIAPPVRHVDADAGVVVMAFVATHPIGEFPGGPGAAAVAAADLLARLHRIEPAFPSHGDHLDDLDRLLAFVGRLPAHREVFEAIRAAYPWDPATFVSAHNDPNQFNLLYDGTRLWLVDWETAKRNDPFIDLATLCAHVAPTPDLQDAVLRRVLGAEPDDRDRARLFLAHQLVRLQVGAILLLIYGDEADPVDLGAALSPERFAAAVERGAMVPGEGATMRAFAATVLKAVVDHADSAEGERALALLG
jgi:hypothetical protein